MHLIRVKIIAESNSILRMVHPSLAPLPDDSVVEFAAAAVEAAVTVVAVAVAVGPYRRDSHRKR